MKVKKCLARKKNITDFLTVDPIFVFFGSTFPGTFDFERVILGENRSDEVVAFINQPSSGKGLRV